nr:PREDICTED: elongin-C isoform X1 [Raphanus sativus]
MRETVKLISMEGFEFVIDKEAAMVSQTIRSMLTSPGGFSESKDGVVTFPDISTTILEKICQYFYWSLQYSSKVSIFRSLLCHCSVKEAKRPSSTLSLS